MTFEQMERSLEELRENQVVQGELLFRIEQTVAANAEAIEKLADGFVLLQSAMKSMVQSVEGLSSTVDRFIRGLGHDGHHSSGEGSEQ